MGSEWLTRAQGSSRIVVYSGMLLGQAEPSEEASYKPYDEDTHLPIDPYSGLLVEPESGRLMTKDEAMKELGIPGEGTAALVIVVALAGVLLEVTGILDDVLGEVKRLF